MIYKHTCPHSAECSAVFDQKQHDPHAPPSLVTQPYPEQLFKFPWMNKFLKGEHFASVEEVKQKTAEALKGIKIDECRNCFQQWKKCLDRCIVSNKEYFEGD